jgi:Lon protease-like protein
METLPMFPLGMVAFPGSVIPLRLFEPRYLTLHDHLVQGNGEFGIVLIERGVAEAGGAENFSMGSVVQLVGSAPFDDGTVMVVTVGTERIRIDHWLDDDPYPKAVIERVPRLAPDDGVAPVLATCRRLLATVLALASELGSDVGVEPPELSDDPVSAIYEIARLVPIQELDQQRILEAEDVSTAASVLRDALEGLIDVLTSRLGRS